MLSSGKSRRAVGNARHSWGLVGSLALALVAGWPLAALADPGDATTAPGRKWIKHRVVPKETLDTIAERYGCTRAEVVSWNRKAVGKKEWIYAGQTLKVNAREFPPPREKVTYRVALGDTWGKIANRFDVPLSHLRAWNQKVPRAFKAGTRLVVWTNPGAPPPDEEESLGEDGAPIPKFDVKRGGLSIGRPNRGSLHNGIAVPDSDMYTVRDADKAFGTSHAIEKMLEAIAAFRRASGYSDKLVIGAMSLKRGGRFRPHSSHQSGRDLDIRMPVKAGVKKVDSVDDIDWGATWALVKAFADTGEVEYIFMSYSRQRLLYRAAKDHGASSSELDTMIQYPRKSRTNNGLIRHSDGHDRHIHVRFKCAPDNVRCESK